ncbi:MAG: 50S ribosomal protein L5 [Candidatus Spechtbacteria bacterium RIFCSPLOWO2_01_FULL_46_10]|uniref:50S ribosomal protein L5 n=1 Tax=Candidatus Spechtbacteria bacterium RIFCSPLOWO2_01_FULL_46_10 TaxID=1802163 RepID=A0A1G2HFR1_9BACT|nr:MAG: 50S ribosomal protein L5 [Candidatus Spechtbacteria bacterium RIFCSPLOWO2_01_FULL_46_10]
MEVLDLKKEYKEKILPELRNELGGVNIYEAPAVKKVVINIGVGRLLASRKLAGTQKSEEEAIADIIEALAFISGQRPQIMKARKSIAGFKLRQGTIVGLRTTLRKRRMYDFIARMVHTALPRTRDFRGIPLKSVDKSGNLNMGIPDISVFPDAPQLGNFTMGLEVTLVTNTRDRDAAIKLFRMMGVPLQTDKK